VEWAWRRATCRRVAPDESGAGGLTMHFTPGTAWRISVVGVAVSTLMRVLAHRHLAQFDPSSLVGTGGEQGWAQRVACTSRQAHWL
jgi:hypothetical protein